jgi:hypothetical protein
MGESITGSGTGDAGVKIKDVTKAVKETAQGLVDGATDIVTDLANKGNDMLPEGVKEKLEAAKETVAKAGTNFGETIDPGFVDHEGYIPVHATTDSVKEVEGKTEDLSVDDVEEKRSKSLPVVPTVGKAEDDEAKGNKVEEVGARKGSQP